MKFRSAFFSFLSLLLIVMVSCMQLEACSLFQKKGTTKLVIRLTLDPNLARTMEKQASAAKTARTTVPASDWTIAHYSIEGTHSDGTVVTVDNASSSTEQQLKPGDWTFTARAFSAAGLEVANGTKSARLQPGRSATLVIMLLPLEGTGSLELSISSSYPLADGEKISGSLSYKGLPGHLGTISPDPIPIEILPGQSVFSLAAIQAGYYELGLCHFDSEGNPAGGLADIILILAGFQTKGSCTIEVGASVLGFSPVNIDPSPLETPLASVNHLLPHGGTIAPLVIPCSGDNAESLTSSWYFNGQKQSSGTPIASGGRLLPANTIACPPLNENSGLSKVQANFIEQSQASGRAASANIVYEFIGGPAGSWTSWEAGYDYRAAMGASLFRKGEESNKGAGKSSVIRAVAGSPSGLIAVSGMDIDSALHVFAAPCGAEISAGEGSGTTILPPSSSWIRLWRDQIRIDGSAKNEDVLAVSSDARRIAATQTGSTTGWLRIYTLDENGDQVSVFDTSIGMGAPSGLRELKALDFSSDGCRLYAISSPSQTIFSYVNDGQTWVCKTNMSIPEAGTGTKNLKDLQVTSSDAIVVVSCETSQLFIYADDGTGVLNREQTIAAESTGGFILASPTAVAVSASRDVFYVLNNTDEILVYGRAQASDPYALLGGIRLPASVAGAKCICAGAASDGSQDEVLCVVGGDGIGFYHVDAVGHLLESDILHPDAENLAGLAEANCVCYAGGAYIIG
ncbi:MAG: hypothetical protein LLF89_00870, partial [Spirochaetaceae bacterium]|nr:hypothetical protein [Spirochaetaceae bacterium]